MWQPLTRDWIIREVGQKQLDFLCNVLHAWIHEVPAYDKTISYRVAPSIIARSECELFAISAPRFAIRAKFRGGWVNLRRIASVRKSVADWSAPPTSAAATSVKYDGVRAKGDSPKFIMYNSERDGTCLADSLFEAPPRFVADWHINTVDVLKEYGEASATEKRNGVVPYAQHISLGGGMCAQAVCFAANLLLIKWSHRVCGVPEVTALARIDDTMNGAQQALPLNGLIHPEITTYFSRVGLACRWEQPPVRSILCDRSWNDHLVDATIFQRAIRAYVISGFPIIANLDTRFLGAVYNQITERVNFSPAPPDQEKMNVHCGLVVGAHQTERNAFLLNDPATLPFLEVTTASLLNARPYVLDRNDDLVRAAYQFGSVTPEAVQLGLLDWNAGGRSRLGLISIAANLSKRIMNRGGAPVEQEAMLQRSLGNFYPGEFALINSSESVSKIVHKHLDLDEPTIQFLEDQLCQFELPEWIWLQVREFRGDPRYQRAVLLWNATRSLGPGEISRHSKDLLMGGILQDKNKHCTWHNFNCQQKQPSVESTQPSEPEISESFTENTKITTSLTPSIISSFSTNPFHLNARHLPAEVRFVDLYAFMQADWSDRSDKSAVTYMSSIANVPDEIDRVADRICEQTTKHDKQICGMASFIPALSQPAISETADEARNAIAFLFRLANAITKRGHGPVRVIEIVVGSRVTGVWPALTVQSEKRSLHLSGETYGATLIADREARANVIDNLKAIKQLLAAELELPDVPLFALELEPGLLFALRDATTLEQIALDLTENGLDDFVGINLDIAHWNMADISPDWLQNRQHVKRLVVHGHLSGYCRGTHFGDLGPLVLNKPAHFNEWLGILGDRFLETKTPRFSGFVALEIEACREELFPEAVSQFLTIMQ